MIFFFCGRPPVVFFLIEKATAFNFRLLFASILKNRPTRGGFLFQLGLRGPNSKLCRWYRTFFEILLRIPAFFGPKRRCTSLSDVTHCVRRPTNCTAWRLLELWTQSLMVERFLATAGGRRKKSLDPLLLIAPGTSTLLSSDPVRYLVDPASSHMLVSKIKPCMSKYKLLYGETADGSLKQLGFP